eukprot:908204-Amorphochlora_amoeboformis.AAC.1
MEPLLTFAGGVESPLSTDADADADADAEPEMLKARDLFLALLFPFDLIALSFASFFTPPVPDPVPGPILASAPAALDFVPRMATAAVFPVSILFMPLVRVQSRLKVWYLELCSLRNRFLRMIKVEHSNSGKDPDPFPDPDPDPDLDPDSEPDMFKSSSALSVPISASASSSHGLCIVFCIVLLLACFLVATQVQGPGVILLEPKVDGIGLRVGVRAAIEQFEIDDIHSPMLSDLLEVLQVALVDLDCQLPVDASLGRDPLDPANAPLPAPLNPPPTPLTPPTMRFFPFSPALIDKRD